MTQSKEISRAMFELSVHSSAKLREYLNYSSTKEKDVMWANIVFEFLYLYLHLISRQLFNEGASLAERSSIMDEISALTINTSIDTLYEDIPPDLAKEARSSFFNRAQDAELQYASCTELLTEDMPLSDKAVLSTFGKNILKLANTPENIQVHLTAVTLAMHGWIEIKKLLD